MNVKELLACLSVLAALVAPPSLRAATVSGRFADGAYWSMLMPPHWNGTLLLYSHGYAPSVRVPDLAPKDMAGILAQRGYALAASSYATPGWAIAEAIPDQMQTLDEFVRRFGKPRRTIAWGTSMGGLVTIALAEQHPDRIDAALPSCGSLAGALGMMNTALDGAFAFKTLLAPGSNVRLVNVDDDRANARRVRRVLDQAMQTPSGRARVALAAALAQLTTWPNAGRQASVGEESKRQLDTIATSFPMAVFLPRVDQERRAGGAFSWTTGVDFRRQLLRSGREPWVQALYRQAGLDLQRDLDTLNSAPRITADPVAVAYMRAYYTPSGRLRVPVFSYHTIGDQMTSNEQQGAYADLVTKDGHGALFADAWVARAGHCAFTPAEHIAALETLEQRLANGSWDATPAKLNARAATASLGASRFVSYTPPAFLRPCARFARCAGEPDSPRYLRVSKSSRYVTVADGTRLAVDIYRPTRRGSVVRSPMPVILLESLGPRSDPRLLEAYGVRDLVEHGYNFVWLQPRGIGASFGKTGGFMTARDGRDVADVIAWINRQPWSSGRVGMLGLSNMGFIQWLTAAQRPAGLVTIVPAVANPDFYYQLYPNGVSALVGAPGVPGPDHAPATVRPARPNHAPPVQPVDADSAPGHPLWTAAQRSHIGGLTLPQQWLVNMYRDQPNGALGYAPGLVDSPLPRYADALRASGIRIYQMGGWWDSSPGGQIVAYRGFGGRLLIGAWPHELTADVNGGPLLRAQNLRWFDARLKGIDDGIDKEPPVRYQTMHSRTGDGWHYAADFPLSSQRTRVYYLAAGRSGTIPSLNDGGLSGTAPSADGGKDALRVDFRIRAFDGTFNRLDRSWDGDMSTGVDRLALTYTSRALPADTEITGFPIAHMWIASSDTDADLIVYLEEVLPDGRSHFVTDGAARASHRAVAQLFPWTVTGVPYHRSFIADKEPLVPGKAVEVDFALNPTSYVFHRGSRIRFTITGAEADVYEPPPGAGPGHPPLLTVFRDKSRTSTLDLPVIPPHTHRFVGTARITGGSSRCSGPASAWISKDDVYLRCADRWTHEARARVAVSATASGERPSVRIRGKGIDFTGTGR